MLVMTKESFKGSPNGATCCMVKMCGRGVKVFEDRADRDLAYNNQNRLACIGLAPETYFLGEIEVTDGDGDTHFTGYVYETELADVLDLSLRPKSTDYNRVDSDEDAEYNEKWDLWADARKPFEAACDGLKEELESIGVTWEDAHAGNIGFIDGHAVLIDCGDNLFDDGSINTKGGACRELNK